MTDIQGKIIEKNERSVLSRAFRAKSDKDAIAAWKQEFNKILQIFNVRQSRFCLAFANGDSSDGTSHRCCCGHKGYASRFVGDQGGGFRRTASGTFNSFFIDDGLITIY